MPNKLKTKRIDKLPLISFCIATYKRSELLRETLGSIIDQTYKNYEVIVSDNDPQGSSKKIVNSFKSRKIIYKKNKENIGAIKNFNKAISYAKGDFIVLLSDDDPVKTTMLKTLVDVYLRYPEYDSYYGACYLLIKDKKMLKAYGLKNQKTSMLNKLKKNNEISLLNPEIFLNQFLKNEIFPYFWWSTGMVTNKLLKRIGGMPEYNSVFFTDYALIGLIGIHGKMAVINNEVGSQGIHMSNSLRSKDDLLKLNLGIKGYYSLMNPVAKKYHCQKELEIFISTWVCNHLLGLKKMQENGIDLNLDKKFLKKIFDDSCKSFSFIKNKRIEFNLRLIFPLFFDNYFFLLRYANFNTTKKIVKFLSHEKI